MIDVLWIWTFMFATTVCVGYGAAGLLRFFAGVQEKNAKAEALSPTDASMTGLVAAGMYAQWWSLFGGVGAAAFAGFALLAGALAWQMGRRGLGLPSVLAARWKKMRLGQRVGLILLILFYAYGTARGYLHTDTTLYHAQSIHWIESYGSVPGLALLHNRLGYNSAAFPLTALFSFVWLTGRSAHAAAGYLALLTAWECLRALRLLPALLPGKRTQEKAEEQKLRLSDFCRVAGLYYLLNIYDEMVSPASDYFMVCGAFFLAIRLLDVLEKEGAQEEERGLFSLGMLSILAVWLATVKLSAAPLVLVAALPIARVFKSKTLPRGRFLATFTAAGFLAALPLFLRNILLTGYLLYPFPAIDLFALPWKIDPGYALSDQREIMVWGRGYTDVLQYDAPLSQWVGAWFAGQSLVDRAAIVLALAALVAYLIVVLPRLLRGRCGKKTSVFVSEGVLLVGLLFWFRSAPLMRYGCVYVYLAAALFAGELYLARLRTPAFAALLFAFLLLKSVTFGRECLMGFAADGTRYLLRQKDYIDPPCIAYEIDGETFYHADGQGTGYAAFPSSPFPAKLRLRGETLRAGFLPADE